MSDYSISWAYKLMQMIPTEEYNARMAITYAPTVDAEPVRHGRWVSIGNTVMAKCSCGFFTDRWKTYRYCPNCGASMRSIDDEVADLPMEAYYNKDWKMDEVDE